LSFYLFNNIRSSSSNLDVGFIGHYFWPLPLAADSWIQNPKSKRSRKRKQAMTMTITHHVAMKMMCPSGLAAA